MPNGNGRNKGTSSNGSSNGSNSGSPGGSSDGGPGHNPRELLLDLDLWTDTGFPTAVAVAVMACVKGGRGAVYLPGFLVVRDEAFVLLGSPPAGQVWRGGWVLACVGQCACFFFCRRPSHAIHCCVGM